MVHNHESNAHASIADNQQDAVLKTVVAGMPPSKGKVEQIEESVSGAGFEVEWDYRGEQD